MGDIADLYDECYGDTDEDELPPSYYYELGPAELVKHTRTARNALVKDIRRGWLETHVISRKQLWVLAYWCSKFQIVEE